MHSEEVRKAMMFVAEEGLGFGFCRHNGQSTHHGLLGGLPNAELAAEQLNRVAKRYDPETWKGADDFRRLLKKRGVDEEFVDACREGAVATIQVWMCGVAVYLQATQREASLRAEKEGVEAALGRVLSENEVLAAMVGRRHMEDNAG